MVFSRISTGDWKPQKFLFNLITLYCALVRISAFIVYKKLCFLELFISILSLPKLKKECHVNKPIPPPSNQI